MLDEQLRQLERAAKDLDTQKIISLARETDRKGKPSLRYWDAALRIEPKNEDVLHSYIRAGGFYAKRVNDPILGNAWDIRNLNFGGQTANIALGDETPDAHSIDYWLEHSTEPRQDTKLASAMIELSFARELYLSRNHPAFKPIAAQHSKLESKRVGLTCSARIQYDRRLTYVDSIAVNGNLVRATIPRPRTRYGPVRLAHNQPEENLGTIPPLSHASRFVLSTLMPNPQETIPAIQYFSPREQDGRLRQVELDISPAALRCSSPVILGSTAVWRAGTPYQLDCAAPIDTLCFARLFRRTDHA